VWKVNVLVIGSGGREHALAWKIAKSPLVDRVLAAPGSAGMEGCATCFPDVSVTDTDAILALSRAESVGLVVIGPEDPLAAGLTDALREQGYSVFGPTAAAAQLEASKSFSKDFMKRHGVPTARYETFEALEPAIAYVREQGGASVVKADGLAAGKGVAMCESPEQAERALREMMVDQRFGDAGSRVVIEEWLRGEEASYYAITDGEAIVTLAAAQDHKRALDGDRGENTGGMGAYSPAPVISEEVEKKVLEQVVYPTIRGMAAEGIPYTGVLFVGLMIDPAGHPHVIEFNVRFGDPETQPLMVRMEGDIVPLLQGSADGKLDSNAELSWGDSAVCVVLASEGHPRGYEKGRAILGLSDTGAPAGDSDEIVIFHAGTCRAEDGGFETSGGRVLGVTARGASVREARDRAYRAVSEVSFEGVQFRGDIAARAIDR
jgi:phosphoribosylamine--glycine ligase